MKIQKNNSGKEGKKIAGSVLILITLLISLFSYSLNLVSAQGSTNGEQVGISEPTVCCEKTNAGLYCQDVPQASCAPDSRSIPTSCESTSFCNPGFCYDLTEGTCLDNVPQSVCNSNGGTWNAERPAQCGLGCCLLGDQASFVTLVRCKHLSGFFGLKTNWNSQITNEAQCILTASAQEKGACLFEKDFEMTCKFTTREECNVDDIYGNADGIVDENVNTQNVEGLNSAQNSQQSAESNSGNNSGGITGNVVEVVNSGEVRFVPGKLCSAEELGTNCAPTRNTICQPGKEEVYFVDTCGNPGNIYDSSKINSDDYWSNIKNKDESCGANSVNGDSQTCGNCNYLLGSYCRAATSETANPTYGDNICQSLNCVEEDGKKRLHGESWCERATGEQGSIGNKFYTGAVGSRDFRDICINGKIRTEPCADFKQEECIENSLETPLGTFSEAACRVNRWQDCTGQRTIEDCTNSDKRDCRWMDGIQYILIGSILNGTSFDTNSLAEARKRATAEGISLKDFPKGACVPENPPGLRFWEGEEAAGICGQANAACPVTYEKKLLGDWECIKNCECLDSKLQADRAQICTALGDCGPKVNWIGVTGRSKGYKVTEEELEKKDD